MKKIFLKGVAFGYFNQALVMVFGFISVPLLLKHFGVEQYGVWSLLVGLVVYFNAFSFGIPAALSTLVAKSTSKTLQYMLLKKSTILLSAITTFVLGIFLICFLTHKAWILVIIGNIEPKDVALIEKVFIVFVVGALIRLPVSLYTQFFVGMNLVYISQIYIALGVIAGFIVVVASVLWDKDLYFFAIWYSLSQIFVSLLSLFHVMAMKANHRMENIKSSDVLNNKEFINTSFAFFQVTLIVIVVWGTDNLIISHILSVSDVTPYAIAFKLFTFGLTFSSIINGVITPIYGNAFATDNWEKIQRIANSVLQIMAVTSGFLWLGFMFFSKDVVLLWTQHAKAFGGYPLFFYLGMYGFFLAFITSYASVIQGLNYVKKTIAYSWLQALLNIFFSILLVKWIGIAGAALGTALAALCSEFFIFPRCIEKLSKGRLKYKYQFLIKHFFILLLPMLLLSIYVTSIKLLWLKLVIFLVIMCVYFGGSWLFMGFETKTVISSIFLKWK